MNHTISIEQVVARARIADLVHNYAKNIRDGETAACVVLFTEDAIFETREMTPGQQDSVSMRTKLIGREAVMNYLNRPEIRSSVCPSVSNLLIDVVGDRASSSCLMSAQVWATGQTLFGEYQDTYRYNGQWRFASRTYTMFRVSSQDVSKV